MHRQIRTRLFWGMCLVLGFTFCAPPEEAPGETGGGYDDLVGLFLEFREPDIGYETAVTVLKVNDAVEAGRRISFEPSDFEA